MTNDQPELRWTDDNPFCDLPHGFEFHLDYFDRFVLQTFRIEYAARFSSFILMRWLQLGRLPGYRVEKEEIDGDEAYTAACVRIDAMHADAMQEVRDFVEFFDGEGS